MDRQPVVGHPSMSLCLILLMYMYSNHVNVIISLASHKTLMPPLSVSYCMLTRLGSLRMALSKGTRLWRVAQIYLSTFETARGLAAVGWSGGYQSWVPFALYILWNCFWYNYYNYRFPKMRLKKGNSDTLPWSVLYGTSHSSSFSLTLTNSRRPDIHIRATTRSYAGYFPSYWFFLEITRNSKLYILQSLTFVLNHDN